MFDSIDLYLRTAHDILGDFEDLFLDTGGDAELGQRLEDTQIFPQLFVEFDVAGIERGEAEVFNTEAA
jgi:hypothetical protein